MVYEEIQATLRMPIVNFIFRVLANYPAFLTHAWNQVQFSARTVEFERAADRLRRQA